MAERRILLITRSTARWEVPDLTEYAKVHWLDEPSVPTLNSILPSVDCIFVVGFWPKVLNTEMLAQMRNLRFIQSTFAGANHIPLQDLPPEVTVCSNAGGFSQGVAEYAWGLLLTAAKRIVKLNTALRAGTFKPDSLSKMGEEVGVLEGKSLGVIGYGGIGHRVAAMGRACGMKVNAFSRHSEAEPGTEIFQGREGLLQVLRTSDAAVISIPLTNKTKGLIGAQELSAMKPNAVLVNVARAEIVNEEEIYRHLRMNPGFTYATDVWRAVDGVESYTLGVPLLQLDNFIGTPHVSGPSASVTGEHMRLAVENLLRYLKGEPLKNVVDRSEYV